MRFVDTPPTPLKSTLLDISVESDLGFKTPLVFRVLTTLQRHGYLPAYGCHLAEVSLEEVLANAIIHGNDLDPAKQVRVLVTADGDRFAVSVTDQGQGFGPEAVPDPDDPEILLAERGRGFMLMDHYMDDVAYHRASRTVTLKRRRQVEPDPGATAPLSMPEMEPAPADGQIEVGEIVPIAVEPRQRRTVQVPDEIELDFEAREIGEPAAEEIAPKEVESPLDQPGAAAAAKPAASEPEIVGPVELIPQGSVLVVAIHQARVSEDNFQSVRHGLATAAERCGRIVLDFSQVQFMSSVGISTIMATYKQVKTAKGKLVLCGVNAALENVFKATGLMRVFVIAPSRDDAVKQASA